MSYLYVSTSGNDTTGDGSSGNPYASPGKAASVVAGAVADVEVRIAPGTYSVTTTTANTSGGPVQHTSYIGNFRVQYAGWNSTDGYNCAPPLIRANVAGISGAVFYISDAAVTLRNLRVDANSQTSLRGIDVRSRGVAIRCISENGTVAPVVGGHALGCVSRNNSDHGFTLTGAGRCIACVAYGNTGKGFTQSGADASMTLVNCVAYGNGSSGFGDIQVENLLLNCLSYDNGGYDYDTSTGSDNRRTLVNCAGGGSTSGNFPSSPAHVAYDFVTLTADPFTNASGAGSGITVADILSCFSPNNVPGGGVLIRGVGFPTELDIGAVQHAEPTDDDVAQAVWTYLNRQTS